MIHPIVGDRIIEGVGTSSDAWRRWDGLLRLPETDCARWTAGARVCILAPHPDDEILGCAGLMQRLALAGRSIVLISLTSGAGSHPGSRQYPPPRLASVRLEETRQALKALGVAARVQTIALNFNDGELYARQTALEQALTPLLRANDILVAPFRHDGHPDHEAAGQVALRLAQKHQLVCHQVLIWAWHWAVPGDGRIDWACASRLSLTPPERARKIRAVQAFQSQIQPDPTTGAAPVLSEGVLKRLTQPWEIYLHEQPSVL